MSPYARREHVLEVHVRHDLNAGTAEVVVLSGIGDERYTTTIQGRYRSDVDEPRVGIEVYTAAVDAMAEFGRWHPVLTSDPRRFKVDLGCDMDLVSFECRPLDGVLPAGTGDAATSGGDEINSSLGRTGDVSG